MNYRLMLMVLGIVCFLGFMTAEVLAQDADPETETEVTEEVEEQTPQELDREIFAHPHGMSYDNQFSRLYSAVTFARVVIAGGDVYLERNSTSWTRHSRYSNTRIGKIAVYDNLLLKIDEAETQMDELVTNERNQRRFQHAEAYRIAIVHSGGVANELIRYIVNITVTSAEECVVNATARYERISGDAAERHRTKMIEISDKLTEIEVIQVQINGAARRMTFLTNREQIREIYNQVSGHLTTMQARKRELEGLCYEIR